MSLGPISILAQLMLALAGFACLAMCMDRHARQVGLCFKRAVRRTQLKVGGWVLLAVAILVAIADVGWSFGLVLVFGVLTLAALLVVGLLTYRPALLIPATTGSGLAGAVLLGFLITGLAFAG